MLVIRVLGGLHITLDDIPVSGFISSKAQALFCYLALNHTQTHLRAVLATLFWGYMTDEDAATNLRQAIANLKKLFEPYLEISRQSVAFHADQPFVLDAAEFEQTGDPQLYRGELLAGFGVSDAPEFDNWLAVERERLHTLALTRLREQAAQQQAAGRSDDAIASLQRVLAFEPLAEDVHRCLMLTLAVNGQRSAALTQHEKFCDLLWDELAVEPEYETIKLYERIKTARRLSELPNETTPFIGRSQELSELTRLLHDPTCRLITIAGLGGMGKTRLALRLAHQQAQRMLHGAVLVPLTSVRTLDAFLSALADGLHMQLMTQGTPRGQLLDFLREKHLLLLLDNVEQLSGIINDFITELTRTAADLKIVMTSRQRFNLRGEAVLALAGLPVSDESGGQAPAQSLFIETAKRVRGDDLIAQQPAQTVRRICELVQGMPLAIELAAAWARLLTVDELALEIANNLTGLESDTQREEERHRSLRAVFDYSWNLFSEQERRVLMALSLFVGGFTRESAQGVAGASLPLLLGLSDKLLVQQQGGGRFALHEMLRQFLAEKLVESPDADRVAQTYMRYLIDYMHLRQPRLKTGEQPAILHEITQEIDNLYFAWDIAIQRGNRAAIRDLLPGLALFHDLKSDWRVAANLLQSAEAVLDPAEVELYGEWLSHLALATSRLDQADRTAELANRCLAVLSRSNPAHHSIIARALLALGYAEGLRGAHDAALPLYEDALRLREALGDAWEYAQCLMRLASGHAHRAQVDYHFGEERRAAMLGKLQSAQAYAQQALVISNQIGDTLMTAHLQSLLAGTFLMEGGEKVKQAEELHLNNARFYESVDSLDGLCMAVSGLGNVCFSQQSYADAVPYYRQSLALARQIGSRVWEANALNNLAVSSYQLNELRAARGYFVQSQAVFREMGNEQYVGMIQQDIDEIDALLKTD
jgi:DNA-binding SARP family transcriptional activator/predicted ATPase